MSPKDEKPETAGEKAFRTARSNMEGGWIQRSYDKDDLRDYLQEEKYANDKELVREGLGDRMRRVRDDSNLTGVQMSERMGCDGSQISKWETGTQVPSWRTLVKWTRATRPELLSYLFHGSAWIEETAGSLGPDSEARHVGVVHLRSNVADELSRKLFSAFIEILDSYQTVSGRALKSGTRTQSNLNRLLEEHGDTIRWQVDHPRRNAGQWLNGLLFSMALDTDSVFPVSNKEDIIVVDMADRDIRPDCLYAFLPALIGVIQPRIFAVGSVYESLHMALESPPKDSDKWEKETWDDSPWHIGGKDFPTLSHTPRHVAVYGVGAGAPIMSPDMHRPMFGGTQQQIQNCLLGRVIYRGGPPAMKP